MKQLSTCLVVIALLLVTQCTSAPEGFKIKFDSSKEVSGKKFAIKDINPELPSNWDEFNFVVLEFRITTSQRFHIGFNTNYGYNELRIMSYVPNAWNKMAIPLKFYRRLPDARIDLAATYNQPRYTGWINLGGRRGELHGVDSIGIRMRVPIGNPVFEIRNITLSVDDPGDEYLGEIPVVDEFGQHNLVDYKEKVRSLEQLQAEWKAEEKELDGNMPDYNYSRFGGYKQKQIKNTGFFRVEKVDGRWWFVDPEGYLFLSHGVDCVNSGGGGNTRDLDKRKNMIKELPPEQFRQSNRGRESASFGTWNLYRRFGENFREKANEMIIKRMDKWGLNTIANWSNAAVYSLNKKAYTLQLRGLAMDGNLMGLADVYAPGFADKMDSAMSAYLPENKDNQWVIGYFVGNEPSWLQQEARLCDLILAGEARPIKTELEKFLTDGNTPERKKEFIYKTFDIFLQTVKNTMKKYDPNHLNLGIRFGNLNELDEKLMDICRNAFDILSFNCYELRPGKEMMDRALRLVDMPMIIGEYHFGTVDRGMAQSLWQVNSQQERGVAYRYYTEQAYSHPGMIGTAYFQWCDQDLIGRGDGENYNCGLIDVTDRPYKYQVEAMMETAKRLYAVHTGEIQPFDQTPVNARSHGGIPDIWNTENVRVGYDWMNAGFPQAEISNGLITAKLYLPDAKKGYYRGSRFDWSGVIYELKYKGHDYFGQWFPKYDPVLHDAICGPTEEFMALGYEQAPAGGEFLRIGIGGLQKPDDKKFERFGYYKLTNPGKWTVKKEKDYVVFTHQLKDVAGYSYEYEKKVILVKGKPQMVLEHKLKNTGKTAIVTSVYNHNFFTIDYQPTGPNSIVKFAFPLKVTRENPLAKINGQQIEYLRELVPPETVSYTDIQGLSNSVKDYDFRIENIKVGAGVRITGDKPVSKLIYWSSPTTQCPEPYIDINIKPGETFEWKITYDFYTL